MSMNCDDVSNGFDAIDLHKKVDLFRNEGQYPTSPPALTLVTDLGTTAGIDTDPPGSKRSGSRVASSELARRKRLVRKRRLFRLRHDRLVRELVLAQEVQRSMLPTRLPEVGSIRCGASLRACEHLAGDFYDVFRLDQDRIGVFLGDVMGHGAAAALLSVYAMQRMIVKRIEGHSYEIYPPSRVLGQLNVDLLAAAFPGEPFVTLVYGILDTKRLTWSYCSAAHPPVWLLRGAQPPQALETSGPPLGVFEADFMTCEIQLEPGDRLVLWSDGVDTLTWPGIGDKSPGLLELLVNQPDADPQELVTAAIERSQPLPGLSDDVALLIMKVA